MKPGFGLIGREEDGHAAVDGADKLIGRAGEDGEGFQRAFGGVPAVPQTGHAKGFLIRPLKPPRNLAAALGFPFQKGVGWDEASAVKKRFAKSRLFRNSFGAGVDALDADLGILGPGGDQAPAQFGHFQPRITAPDDGGPVRRPDDGLGGGRDFHLTFTDFGLFVLTGVFGAHGCWGRIRIKIRKNNQRCALKS